MTAADYAALAFCPAMIVLMLAALVHFLILCIYHGQYTTRLTYILFMFIVGATGIARISVQFGRVHASVYAGVLGLATVFVLSTFSNPFFAISMVLIVWLLADHITYDCTVIDDDTRASGEGLLGAGGFLGGRRAEPVVDVRLDGTTAEAAAAEADSRSRTKRKRGPKKPGRSVFLLALAALPLFGIGQLTLSDAPDLRRRAALALAVYLFATLTLLVTTSFLGLRAYLRRRNADMPANVSVGWIVGGIVLTLGLLIVCFALPVPGNAIANIKLPQSLESPEWLDPSRYGWGSEGTENPGDGNAAQGPVDPQQKAGTKPGDEDATAGGQGSTTDESGQPSDGESEKEKPSDTGEKPNSPTDRQAETSDKQDSQGSEQSSQDQGSQNQDSSSGDSNSKGSEPDSQDDSESQSGESQQEASKSENGSQESSGGNGAESGDSASDPQQNSGSDSSENAPSEPSQSESPPAETPPASTPPAFNPMDWLPNLSSILKVLIGLVLLGIIAWFVVKQRHAIKEMWRRFCDYWKRLQREAGMAEDPEETQDSSVAYRAFASFAAPAAGDEPRQLIVRTFQALEAWTRESELPRDEDETPTEFAQRLGRQFPEQAADLQRLSSAYNRVVYGRRNATAADLGAAKKLWQWMRPAVPA